MGDIKKKDADLIMKQQWYGFFPFQAIFKDDLVVFNQLKLSEVTNLSKKICCVEDLNRG